MFPLKSGHLLIAYDNIVINVAGAGIGTSGFETELERHQPAN